MAQSTKTNKSSKSKSSNSRNGARRTATSSKRSSSNGRRTTKATPSRNGAGSVADAVDKAKTTGRTVAEAASKARTPLIAGGTALAGAAVGAVMKSRLGAGSGRKNPLKRLGGSKPISKLGKFDIDTVKTVASQMKAYGQQASDIADAVEKTRKKN